MENKHIDVVTVSAQTVETEAKTPIKEKVSKHLEQAKAEGKTRAQRIRDIFQSAFSEAVVEVKGGSHELWALSKDSIAEVLEMEAPTEAAPKPSGTENAGAKNSGAAPPAQPFWKSALNHLRAKAQTRLSQQLSQESKNWPDRFSTVQRNAAEWDQELSEKYGDRYSTAKQTVQQVANATWTQAVSWYRQAKLRADTLETSATSPEASPVSSPVTPIEQTQSDLETEAAAAGAAVAQKERQIKQQIQATVHSVLTADA